MAAATYCPKLTGTAFPIICSTSVLEPKKWNVGGNVWI